MKRGFTLLELLIVIGIIALLVGLLMPALGKARSLALTTKCMSQQQQLTRAWVIYSDEHKQAMPYGFPIDKEGAFVYTGSGEDPIKQGALWPYTRNLKLWKCPADDSKLDRTYSIIAPMRGENWTTSSVMGADRLSRIANPSRQLVFMEEVDYRGWNQGSWQLPVTQARWFEWTDYVLPLHGQQDASTLSFADGHAETWTWTDPDTLTAAKNHQVGLYDPGNQDWLRLRGVYRQLASAPGIPGWDEVAAPQ